MKSSNIKEVVRDQNILVSLLNDTSYWVYDTVAIFKSLRVTHS